MSAATCARARVSACALPPSARDAALVTHAHVRYVTELPLNKTRATELVAQMKADKWTDQSTRSVAVNFNLYNTNTKLLTVARVVFEVDFTGNFIIFAKLYTLKLVVYGWKGTTIYDYSDVVRYAMTGTAVARPLVGCPAIASTYPLPPDDCPPG